MARQYSSVAVQTTLSLGMAASSSGTTGFAVTVGAVTGWPTSYPYTIIIDPDTASEEVCTVTAAVGTALTVTRGVDGTSAPAHSAGAVVKHGVSARDFSEPQVHIDNTTTAHGVTGAVVGTTSTQTLTNKTIAAGSNTISGLTNTNIAAGAAIDKTKISGTAITAADTGTVTSTMILDGTIVDADVNAAAAIAKTKIAGTAITATDTLTVTNAMLAGSIAPAKIAGTAITATDTGTVTSTMILDGTIVNGDINAAANIAVSKLAASSVTIGSTAVTLGGTAATVAGLTLTSPTANGATLDAASTIGGISGTTIAADHAAWAAWTPTITSSTGWTTTNLVATTSRYLQVGKTVYFFLKFKATGSVTVGSGSLVLSLPVNARKAGTGLDVEYYVFTTQTYDATNNVYISGGGFTHPGTNNSFYPTLYFGPISSLTWNSGSPMSVNSWISVSGVYEAA